MSDKLLQIAQFYLNDPKLKKEDVSGIFDWLKTEPHLPELTEFQVLVFLHSCYYNPESAKISIENYFSLKTDSPLYKTASEELVRRTLASFFTGFLPKRTPDGIAIGLIGIFDYDPKKYDCEEQLQTMITIQTLYFLQNGPVNGYCLILDSEGATFAHLFRCNWTAIRQWLFFAQEAAPIRVKAIHFINCVPVTKHLIALLKPFLKKEIYDSIRVHSESLDTLYEYVPKACLPEEYGGELASVHDIQKANLENYLDHLGMLHWHDTQIIDKSKKVERASNVRGLVDTIQSLFWRK